MTNFLKELEEKIHKELMPDKIELINNSDLHKTHKSFDINKLHLKLIIYSKKMREMNRITAHKKILSLVKEEMKNKIHALEIKIK